MDRIRRSIDLGRASWAVLREHRGLAALPALGMAAQVAVAAVVAGAAWAVAGGSGDLGSSPAVWLVVAVGYVAAAFVTTYVTAALVVGADTALRGGEATVADSVAGANRCVHRLLPWSVLTATVAMLLRAFERQGVVGEVVASLLGMAWSVLTFLAVPVLVLEDATVGRTLARSKELLGRTWGENVAGQLGLGLLGMVLVLPGVVVALAAAASGVGVVVVLGLAAAVAWMLVVSVAMAALSGIYRTALYRYAVDGVVPAAFEAVDLAHAFTARRRRRVGF